MTKVFISYRRDDSKVIAGRIYDYLTPPLGTLEPHDVFKDVDSIPPGVNFKKHLEKHVAQCAVALVIIGPSWLNIKDEDGLRRLDDEADFVRVEIESALKREIPVIPLLVMGAQMPKPSQLPATLAQLAFQNGLFIRDDPDFRTDMGRLKKALEHWLNPEPPSIEVVQPLKPIEPAAGTLRKDDHGIEMVYVPAGTFLMGSDKSKDEYAQDNELPQHKVTIPKGFWIDRLPVTNIAYRTFILSDGYQNETLWTKNGWEWLQSKSKSGKIEAPVHYDDFDAPNQPRVGITWYEAMAYCAWRGVRLPNEAEWEYAARGKDGNIYSWGNVLDSKYLVTRSHSKNRTAIVGSKPEGISWVGALDMLGNVWEWTTSLYDDGKFSYPFKDDGRDNLEAKGKRSVRGGAWWVDDLPIYLRSAYRYGDYPTRKSSGLGFRCVSDVLP